MKIHRMEQCKETNEKYYLPFNKRNKIYCDMVNNLLMDKSKIIKIINTYLNPATPINESKIEICQEKNIRRKYKNANFNSLYIDSEKLIFFLTIYKNSLDINLPYKVLNYCVDIIQEWNKKRNSKIAHKYPIVVPTVIYSGKEKWNIPKDFKYSQMEYTSFGKYKIDLKYNLISLNKIINNSKVECIPEIEDFIVIESL